MRVLAAVALPVVWLCTPAAAQNPSVPAPIVAQLDQIRGMWPEVPGAEMRDGRRMEFSDGRIKIGTAILAELEAAPRNESGVVLAFLLGHEAWHAVQAARLTPGELEALRGNGMRECEADYMGAAAAYRLLAARGLDAPTIDRAYDDLLDHIEERAARAGNGGGYLPSDLRLKTIMVGWGQAERPELIRYEGRDAPPASEHERARDTCRKFAQVGNEASASLTASLEPSRVPEGENNILTVRLENRSARTIIASFLQVSWLGRTPPLPGSGPPTGRMVRAHPKAFEAIDGTIRLRPREKREIRYSFRYHFERLADGWTHMTRLGVGDIVSRFDSSAKTRPTCVDRVAGTPPAAAADRAFLLRLAAIAGAAKNDFEAVRGEKVSVDPRGHQVIDLIPALDPEGRGSVILGSGNPGVMMLHLIAEKSPEAVAEYSRIRTLLRGACGEQNVVDGERRSAPGLEEVGLVIDDFAPEVTLYVKLVTRHSQEDEGVRDRGGDIHIFIARDG